MTNRYKKVKKENQNHKGVFSAFKQYLAQKDKALDEETEQKKQEGDKGKKTAAADKKMDFWKIAKNVIAFIVFPVMTFYFLEAYTHNIFEKMNMNLIWFNFLFFWLLAAFLFFLMGKLRRALMTETIFFGAEGLANYYVYRFRSNPILPWDVYSLKTAASVSGNYDYSLSSATIKVIVAFVVMAIAIFFVCDAEIPAPRKTRKRALIRLIGAVLSGACIFWYGHALQQDAFIAKMGIYDKLFTPDTMQYKDGDVVAFLMELKYFNVQKPDNYSAEEAESILSSYEDTDSQTASDKNADNPNIIVIMNEAFSDPGILTDFTPSEDYMPFVHSLEQGADNTITGSLDVSVLGGNTANTEFEFLTGNTMAFMTDGSIPYQQYIHQNIPSLVTDLEKQGYATISMHPYRATGWNRNKVYPYMGFDTSLFQDDFVAPVYIRDYISDESCFEMIEEQYEKKAANQPMFLFNVTMQNHGGYTKASMNFSPDISVAGVDDYAALSYLSLMKRSDEALEKLIDYFKQQDQKTVIVMFGDHQPSDSVVNPLLALNGKSCSTMTEQESYDRYKVPLVIWANYDIKEEQNVEMSANYLSSYIMKVAGVKLSAYQNFLSDQAKSFPIMSAERIETADGTSYAKDSVNDQFSDQMNHYEALQYFNLFDWAKQNKNASN